MKKFLSAAITGALILAVQNVSAITMQFSSLTGASVEFIGTSDTFSFLPGSPADQFGITLSDGVGDSLGKQGRMDGTWQIGAITTDGLGNQSAPVTGSGTLYIADGSGFTLTASLDWQQISSGYQGGRLNGVLNLGSITYAGVNSDFITLATPGAGTETVSFSFWDAQDLAVLTTDGQVNSTAFSGRLTSSGVNLPPAGVPDSGASALLLGLVLAGLSGVRRFLAS